MSRNKRSNYSDDEFEDFDLGDIDFGYGKGTSNEDKDEEYSTDYDEDLDEDLDLDLDQDLGSFSGEDLDEDLNDDLNNTKTNFNSEEDDLFEPDKESEIIESEEEDYSDLFGENDNSSFDNVKNKNNNIDEDDFLGSDSEDDFGDDFNNTKTNNNSNYPPNSNNKNNNKNKTKTKKGLVNILNNALLDKLIKLLGINKDSILAKIIKLIVIFAVVLTVILVIIPMIFTAIFLNSSVDNTNNEKDSKIETTEEAKESKKGKGLFSFFNEDLSEVSIEDSYNKKHIKKVKNEVFNYKSPIIIKGSTFKVFNVEKYDLGTDKEYIRVDFGIKNESEDSIKFNEYDFKLYTKEGLETRNEKLDTDSIKDRKTQIDNLKTSKGLEPILARTGNNTTTLGKGVVNKGEVYSSYIIFETDGYEEYKSEGLVLEFSPKYYKTRVYSKLSE